MHLRLGGIAVALLASSFALAQRPSQTPGKRPADQQTTSLERAEQERARAVTIDTRVFFPQISMVIVQKAISPENPTRYMGLTGSTLLGGSTSMTSAPGPTVGTRFPGLFYRGSVPADPDVAVGPAHIVQVVNTEIGFFSKAGSLQFSTPASSFFSGVAQTTFFFDPKVMYDRIAGRFVIVFLERQLTPTRISNFLFAVSDDSDPNGTWHTYAFDGRVGTGGSEAWADYPGFGYNKDGYVINANLFTFADGTFAGIEFITVPKTPVLTGSAVTTTRFTDVNADSAQMAETVDPVNGFVFGAALRSTTQTRIYAAGNIGGTPTLVFSDVTVSSAPAPPSRATSTNGVLLDTVGSRIFTAIWRGGSLYLSYNVANGSLTGVRWTELNTGNWPTSGSVAEIQAGNYMSGSLNYFMPAINVNKFGDVSILFTGSNTSVTSDIVVATRLASDPLHMMSAPTVMASATGNQYCTFRWGDYFGIDVDPVDDETFWGTAMVVNNGNPDWWDTHIVSWTVSQTTMHAPGTFQWTRGLLQSGNLASLASNDGDYLIARAGLTLFAGEPPAQLIVNAIGPSGSVRDLELSVVAKVNTPGLTQRIELWNFANSTWDSVGTQSSTTSDSIQTGVAGGTPSDYLEPGTNNMRAKVVWYQTGLTLLWPWTVSVNQIEWAVRTGRGSGARIAFVSTRDGNSEIYVMNPDGSGQTRLTTHSRGDFHPAFSQDRSKIAFTSTRDSNQEIYVMDADGTGQTRLTISAGADFHPAFSPDGSKIAFTTNRDGNYEIYVMNADGSGQTRLTISAANEFFPVFSPDGSKIAFQTTRDGNYEIYVMNADASGQTRLTTNAAIDWTPVFSPDGSKIAFTSFRDGNAEIYIMNADGSGQTNLTNSVASDSDPVFSPDGSKIVFATNRDGNSQLYVMNLDGTGQARLSNNLLNDSDPSYSGGG